MAKKVITRMTKPILLLVSKKRTVAPNVETILPKNKPIVTLFCNFGKNRANNNITKLNKEMKTYFIPS